MDPLSATASLVGIVDVALRTTSALISYAYATQNASTNRKQLAEETSSLQILLKRLKNKTLDSKLDIGTLDERDEVLRQFQEASDELAGSLNIDNFTGLQKQESRFKSMRTSAKWAFNKSQVYLILGRIARLQQVSNTLLLSDQSVLLEAMDTREMQAATRKLKIDILNWLSPLQMARKHQNITALAQRGSGRWFLSSDEFAEWEKGTQKLLWCSGIPGAGKTIIASIVYDHLCKRREQQTDMQCIAIGMIYLKYNDPEQNVRNILGSLLRQILQEYETIPEGLQDLYQAFHDPNTPPSVDEISATILSLLKTSKQVFFILDGLDECNDETRWELLDKLLEFRPQANILITSRFRDSIEEALQDFRRLEIKAQKEDIELFVDEQIQRHQNLRRLVQKNPAIRSDIKESIVKTADGMFLLARLHLKSLADAAGLTTKNVRNKLQTLPTTLSATYEEAMRRIENQDPDTKQFAIKILAWITYAFRTLSLKELQGALAVKAEDTDIDEDDIIEGHSIIAICAGLVIIDPGTDTVTLVHYTTKKYLDNNREIYFPRYHEKLTITCANMLSLPALGNTNIWDTVKRYPLACYAAQYMADHARDAPEEALGSSTIAVLHHLISNPNRRKPLLSLLDGLDLIKTGFYSCSEEPRSKSEHAKLQQFQHDCNAETPACGEDTESTSETLVGFGDAGAHNFKLNSETQLRVLEVTALHLAASMGLVTVASMLLKDTSNIDAVDESGKTALMVAMERGFEKAVEFLVRSGAAVDLDTDHGRGFLLVVAERNWLNVGEIIVRRARDDKSILFNESRIPLMITAYSGHIEQTFKVQLKKQITASEARDHGVEAVSLFIAVERSHLDVVQLLLSAGVDVDSKDSIGQTALHRATRCKNAHLMQALINHGAKIEARDDDGLTPWSANLGFQDKEGILNLLMEAGADPNTRANHEISGIYNAAAAGDAETIKYMLKSGTDPSLRTIYDWAPLHWASANGKLDCIKLLIEGGAELSPISDQDTTPLDLAIGEGQTAAIKTLITFGAKRREEVTTATFGLPSHYHATRTAAQSERHLGETNLVRINPDKTLTLNFDQPIRQGLTYGQFIYLPHELSLESDLPFYQISHMLNTQTQSLSVKHSYNRPEMKEYPLKPERFSPENILYTIIPLTDDYQELKLCDYPCSPRAGAIFMRRAWTGSWKVHHEAEGQASLLFRSTPDLSQAETRGFRWTADDGKLLARTSGDQESRIMFKESLDRKLLDMLVTCWIAKLWSETLFTRKQIVPSPLPNRA